MGCPCEIGLYGTDFETVQLIIADVENEVHRLDQKYSHFRSGNFIMRLQIQARQLDGVDVDPETAALLDYAFTQYKHSQGLFDLTTGRLARLWYQRDDLPSKSEIDEALRFTGWSKLQWQSGRLHIPAGMSLELGGIVKEYAADRAAVILKRSGVHSAFVELGGDIHVTGSHPDGSPWKMGIRRPGHAISDRKNAIASIPLHAGGLATSGNYERSNLIDGRHYGHIINPKTGWPIDSFQSVSVLAPSCLLAGSMSTMAMLMGEVAGLDMLQSSGFRWLAQTSDGDIHSESSDKE